MIDETRVIEKEIRRLEEESSAKTTWAELESGIELLVSLARDRLKSPTTEMMAAVFDVIDLEITRITGSRYEGLARIPIFPIDVIQGDVSSEELKRLS